MKLLIALISCLWLISAHAEITENDPRIEVQTIEPARDVGYHVGDVFERTVILTAKKPLKLLRTSLPIPGYERRYKGQLLGVDLRSISTEESETSDTTTYTLHLAYQVFTNNIVAKPAVSPAEVVKFGAEGKFIEFRIPSWGFRVSPLAVYGSVKIENDMSKLRGPLLLNSEREQLQLKLLLAMCGISLLGLFYVLGTSTWLPRMGGPFARACRDIKKLPATPEGLALALERVHQAFNASVGVTVFDSAGYIGHKPAFSALQDELNQFFSLSRGVFFEQNTPQAAKDAQAWLLKFCRRCRDFERGLK